MPTTYIIYADRGYVHTIYTGEVTIADMIGQFHRLNADPMFKRGMDTIVDFSGTSTAMMFDEAYAFSDHLRKVHLDRGPCRWALVVPENFQFGIANMFLAFFEGIAIDIKPFRSLEEARKWIIEGREKAVEPDYKP